MEIHEQTLAKIKNLPEHLVDNVSDFIDFLLIKQDTAKWQLWLHFKESLDMGESDMSDYLFNLETYENQLARGEINW
jgi:hypothetical protein